ncbi:MAG TPA: glycine betaine ABC transporter substrate-binding protein, partial [Thermoanaerobaculia bacterium]|nr:glycine betaine ABC transporter substrate-binding protein [Thermoanaerobaculia bacterium]
VADGLLGWLERRAARPRPAGRHRRWWIAALLLAASAGGIVAIRAASAPRIVVGSKNFTEQEILGEIAAQQLERRLGARVTRTLDIGGTLLAHEALVAGEIDLYPEYTGTALTAILKLPAATDPKAVFDTVAKEYRSRWKLVWLSPLGFDDTFAMVIRGGDARSSGIATLSQAAQWKKGWVLGVGYEFLRRPDGLAGLQKTYALPLEGTPKTMDLGLLYAALEQGQVDLVAANSTDGLLAERDFKVLEDDRKYFPPYEAAFVVNEGLFSREPKARAALEELSGKLTTPIMQRLNAQVVGKHRRPTDVAAEFLDSLYTRRAVP